MNEIGDVIGYILTAIGGIISAITLFYKAFSSTKQKSFERMVRSENQVIRQKKEDAEFYRKRWLQAERENERLRKELHHYDN